LHEEYDELKWVGSVRGIDVDDIAAYYHHIGNSCHGSGRWFRDENDGEKQDENVNQEGADGHDENHSPS
jgi:hypothetical protein